MGFLVELIDVWAAPIPDVPGGLADVLEPLQQVGADFQSIIARRSPDDPGRGVVFVTPLRGDEEVAAAAQVGFNVNRVHHSIRIVGQDRKGIAAELTQKLAAGGVNLSGFSASVLNKQFVAYVAVDSLEDANKAIEILEKA